MNKFIAIVLVSAAASSTAYAKDLPEKQASIQDSLSGASVDRIKNNFAKNSKPVSLSVNLVSTSLQKAGRAQATADSKVRARWRSETDNEAGKLRVLRERTTKDGAQSPFGEREEYVGKRVAFDDASLVERGTALLRDVVGTSGLLGPGEELRVDSTGTLRYEDGDSKGVQTQVVVAAQLTMRRYVDGVPVVGPRGEASALFDADGSLLEVSIPSRAYTRGAAWVPAKAKPALLDETLSKAGLAGISTSKSLGLTTAKGEVFIDEYRCGYVDDATSEQLKIGCDVAYRNPNRSTNAAVLLLDSAQPVQQSYPKNDPAAAPDKP